MAIAIEFISVIVPVRRIMEKHLGGMELFHDIFGDCETDGELVRLGAMNWMDVLPIVMLMEWGGLQGLAMKNGGDIWLDFCVVDRFKGPTMPCDWLEVDLEQGQAAWTELVPAYESGN